MISVWIIVMVNVGVENKGIIMSLCAEPSCNHLEYNHKVICNGSLECMCQKYVPPFLHEFAQEVEANKAKFKTIYDRSKFILEKIPPMRNAGEKSFAAIYREIWYGFKIRAQGTSITRKEWKRMPHDDSINRAKRKVKQDHAELATYDSKVLYHQAALYQAIVEMAIE